MHVATYAAFKDELEKLGWHAGAEIAGLGLLAAPTAAKHFGGKEWSEKNKRRAELGGLGILAAPAAHSMYKAVKKGGLAALKHASADPALVDGALSLFKASSIDKEALFGFGAPAKEVAKKVFKPSFAGHAKALGTGTNIAKSGVETVKSFNPLTQTMHKSKSISIPGLR